MFDDFDTVTIPAAPGFFVASVMHEDGEVAGLCESPVVAWNVMISKKKGLEPTSIASPVLAEEWLDSIYFIKYPDGRYMLPEDRFGMTEEEALSYAKDIFGGKNEK